jgi:hypothetical protein
MVQNYIIRHSPRTAMHQQNRFSIHRILVYRRQPIGGDSPSGVHRYALNRYRRSQL